ncbi:SDR family NAD(P)-dependent oxidoreductase [Sabulilitoribacter arenilitoris]|uniref:SDR family NAD(P)-dependent oxidoreductase n=1 Tax=Wocania arenilitoris TaxID=2044858 RepID=A0AAE3EKJ0_9FLAO|nr:SDR family NAD(P)-dependent oxidoreductase [Wocania arenilitoris]MCF7566953.1 SDR family NAD(P)-dependent oxidoreductase [Wocania arenilitoris]
MGSNKKVLITGASMGIGRALAKKFLENGFFVIGTGRNSMIENFNDDNFYPLKLDISNSNSVKEAKNKIFKIFKSIDILINNAGIGPDLDTLFPDKESFTKTFEVNTIGTVFFTEFFIPLINNNGMILNISSKMGSIDFCKLTDSVAYRMSKSALNMYTKILANRLYNNIKVASIHPGWVQTTIAKSNINGRLTPEKSAENIFRFIQSDFQNGIFWNSENDTELSW